MRLAAIALVLFAGIGGVAHASSGAFVPPMNLDIGRYSARDGGDVTTGTEYLLGLNAATLYPRPMPFDLGVGWIHLDGDAPATHPTALVAATGTTPAPTPAPSTSRDGWYITASGRLPGATKHWRSWLTARSEFFPGARTEYGAAVRLSTELWAGALAADGNCAVVGTIAIGAWFEVGERGEEGGGVSDDVATGLSVRIPLLLAD